MYKAILSESVNVSEVFFFTCVRDWLLGCALRSYMYELVC
jgi:hypothetical protein